MRVPVGAPIGSFKCEVFIPFVPDVRAQLAFDVGPHLALVIPLHRPEAGVVRKQQWVVQYLPRLEVERRPNLWVRVQDSLGTGLLFVGLAARPKIRVYPVPNVAPKCSLSVRV